MSNHFLHVFVEPNTSQTKRVPWSSSPNPSSKSILLSMCLIQVNIISAFPVSLTGHLKVNSTSKTSLDGSCNLNPSPIHLSPSLL